MNITTIFPDGNLPENTRVIFKDQDEFRKFITEHQDSSWDAQLHTRPSSQHLMDHYGSSVVQAFPFIFPYGHSGFEDDLAVVSLANIPRQKDHMKRNFELVIHKFLLHRKTEFHAPKFNLIANNLLMKQTIFKSAKVHCNCKRADSISMAEKFGNMKSNELESAIKDIRQNMTT